MANIACKQKDERKRTLLQQLRWLLYLNAQKKPDNENTMTNQTDGFSPECIDKLAASEQYLAAQWLQHRCRTSSEEWEYEERAWMHW